jgi:hypothetical protein
MPFPVCDSTGSTRPKDVMNRTTVPFGTGDPLFSSTVAVNVAEPPVGRIEFDTVSVMREFVGASKGAVSHAIVTPQTSNAATQATRASNQEGR